MTKLTLIKPGPQFIPIMRLNDSGPQVSVAALEPEHLRADHLDMTHWDLGVQIDLSPSLSQVGSPMAPLDLDDLEALVAQHHRTGQ